MCDHVLVCLCKIRDTQKIRICSICQRWVRWRCWVATAVVKPKAWLDKWPWMGSDALLERSCLRPIGATHVHCVHGVGLVVYVKSRERQRDEVSEDERGGGIGGHSPAAQICFSVPSQLKSTERRRQQLRHAAWKAHLLPEHGACTTASCQWGCPPSLPQST